MKGIDLEILPIDFESWEKFSGHKERDMIYYVGFTCQHYFGLEDKHFIECEAVDIVNGIDIQYIRRIFPFTETGYSQMKQWVSQIRYKLLHRLSKNEIKAVLVPFDEGDKE